MTRLRGTHLRRFDARPCVHLDQLHDRPGEHEPCPPVGRIGNDSGARARRQYARCEAASTDPERTDHVEPRKVLELDRALTEFAAAGFGPFRSEWECLHAHQRKPVTLLLPDGRSERGEARGVAEDGSLLLETPDGIKRFHSGEVSLDFAERYVAS